MQSDELWAYIPDFPKYLIGDRGSVWNLNLDRPMAESKTVQGDLKVTLVNSSERVTRSVRVLVAEAFVPQPFPEWDTVIVLNNDKNNVASYNLAWRPLWFAQKYARQFKDFYRDEYYTLGVINTETNERFSSIIQAAMNDGVLMDYIFKSAMTGEKVFPYNIYYAFT